MKEGIGGSSPFLFSRIPAVLTEPSRWCTESNRVGTTHLDAESNEIAAEVILADATLKHPFADYQEERAPSAATT